ncbi:hypothetical protein MKX01_014893 [Papaver californicum]|nr:hypothetical protein MKX01_014893 [Papaver californicum]
MKIKADCSGLEDQEAACPGAIWNHKAPTKNTRHPLYEQLYISVGSVCSQNRY